MAKKTDFKIHTLREKRLVYLFCSLIFCNTTFISFFSISSIFSTTIKAEEPKQSKNDSETNKSAQTQQQLPIDELRTFAEVYNLIKSVYVDDVEDEKLIKGAINGMLDSLDPHSTFLDKDSYQEIQESSAGQYGGLGIEVVPDDQGIKIITPIDDSPAKRAGILAGDRVVRVNNTPLRNIKAEDAMELMRGKLGEKVSLKIRRQGEANLLEFNLTRELIKLNSIRSQWLGHNLGYIRITQFQKRTGFDLKEAINKLKTEHDGDLSGLILDLRNNPGGVLVAAQDVSNSFIEKGLIISTKGRAILPNYSFEATRGDILKGAPIVVLINGGSASAAEIVAGALQDHKRAVIMGTRSFGKGSVQTLIPIEDDTALKMTTARYYTPSGRSIQGHGINPDVVVHQKELPPTDTKSEIKVHESDLKGALKNNQDVSSKSEVDVSSMLNTDFQLSEAHNLLIGMSILNTHEK